MLFFKKMPIFLLDICASVLAFLVSGGSKVFETSQVLLKIYFPLPENIFILGLKKFVCAIDCEHLE